MEEFDFIRSITPKYYRQPSIIKGIGDDAAIIRHPYEDLITTVDTMVENVHFSSQTTEPFHIGYRVLAANISDIAAMGGKPTSYLVSMVIPDHWELSDIRMIYQGMDQLARQFQMDVIGGDTVSGDQLSISITVFGTVHANKARYRNDAKPGDVVFVTGTLGDAACGLHVLLQEDEQAKQNYRYMVNRHRMPMPRPVFIQACQSLPRISLNDISDGIANEANEIAEASQVKLHIYYDQVPKHPQLSDFSEDQQKEWSLSGGEDFELIGTIPEKDIPVLEKVAAAINIPVTLIGRVEEADKHQVGVWLHEQDQVNKLDHTGYTHLRR
ncbi:thiamine-phosphate kinase [Gracilibacillus phocaeensis]|uniref:thiamine-phosphate kinase n=1 Tax=Gracilibacillus phocaeensis TaxID=2042304 RepID=UPI00103050E3|nr:thiamine-phosphate kinase [Gracilibacillus phocaeensis]